MTISYYLSPRYLALKGRIKCNIEEWIPQTTIWFLIFW